MAIFLIEKSGETRQAFGPYKSVGAAKAEAGKLYAVVSSATLQNGETLTRHQVQVRLHTGSLVIEGGSSIDGLA